jgi:TolB protein
MENKMPIYSRKFKLTLLFILIILSACQPFQPDFRFEDTNEGFLGESNQPTISTEENTLEGLIAFEIRDGSYDSRLFTIEANGENLSEIGFHKGYLTSWSPDSRQIVYVNGINRVNELFIVDASGENYRRLTTTPGAEGIPAWSPDGEFIAIGLEIDGDDELLLINPSNGEIVRQLTDNIGINDMMAAWSPDGNQILYVTNHNSQESMEINIMDRDGSNKRQITENDFLDFYPAWSPNGIEFAFVSERSGENQIYLMDIESEYVSQLTFDSLGASRPAWSPDGTKIAFHQYDGNVFSIHILDVISGDTWLLVENGAHPSWTAYDHR